MLSGPLIGDERRGLVGLPRRCGTPPPAAADQPGCLLGDRFDRRLQERDRDRGEEGRCEAPPENRG